MKAHNEAIHVLATQGLLGAAAVAVLTVGLVLAAWGAWGRASGCEKLLLIAICAGTVGFYVQNVFGFTVAGCGTLFVTFAALLSRLRRPAPVTSASAKGGLKSVALGLIGATILAALAFALNLGRLPSTTSRPSGTA